MDIVDIAVEELQFEYDLIDSFLNDFPEPAMEEGYVETEGHVVDDDNSSSSSNNNNTENKSSDDSTKDNSATEKNPKMYDVNKHRDDNDKADFISKIESFFKMIFEMITRAISTIKAKFARAVSGQKTFAKEMEKLQKNKKPNLELKCKNYLYNDKVIENLTNSLNIGYTNTTRTLDALFNVFSKIKDDPDGFDNTTIYFYLDNGNYAQIAIKDIEKKSSDYMIAFISAIGNSIGIKGELGGAGDFYDAVRRMFRGSSDVVEFQLKAKQEELSKAMYFIKNYEGIVNSYLNKLDDVTKNFKRYQTVIGRYKNADIPKSDGRSNFNFLLTQLNKGVTFICNCYTFIVSLMQERLLNCRNLIRRAYGKI